MEGSLKTFREVCVIHCQDTPVVVPDGAGSSLEDSICVYDALLFAEFEVDKCRLCFVKEKAFAAASQKNYLARIK